MANYDRLTALDNSFLLLEKSNAYMHIASTQIYDSYPLRLEDGGIEFDRIKKAHAAILHRIPRYRQVLRYVPFTQRPVWVDDPHFDLDYHLRHTSLPKPGNDDQLKRLSARIMQQHLDRRRPLWENWVVEGLEGDRFAVIMKVHHCMVDGVSGAELLQQLLSPTPDGAIPTPSEYIPRPAPSGAKLLRDEIARQVALPFRAVRDVGHFVREARDVRREIVTRARAVAETLGGNLRLQSGTPINQPIGPHRRFDWMKMSIAEVKQIRQKLGGSLNDVVLTVVAGAFRRFLTDRGVDIRELDFRVMAPVSVRSEDESGSLGNRVSVWILDLPIADPDPRSRLDKIREKTAELKESRHAVGADLLTQAADWTPSALLSLGARNMTRLLPFNAVCTNVPGPQFPMYLVGAKLLEAYPQVPVVDNLGLGIALFSYDGQLHLGVNADRDVVPDLRWFLDAIEAAYEELLDLAGVSRASR